jgi:hypothetical protein
MNMSEDHRHRYTIFLFSGGYDIDAGQTTEGISCLVSLSPEKGFPVEMTKEK